MEDKEVKVTNLSDPEELREAIEAIWKMSKTMMTMKNRLEQLEEKVILHSMSQKAFLDTIDNINERLENIDDFLESL